LLGLKPGFTHLTTQALVVVGGDRDELPYLRNAWDLYLPI
jgi:hypothetical protein